MNNAQSHASARLSRRRFTRVATLGAISVPQAPSFALEPSAGRSTPSSAEVLEIPDRLKAHLQALFDDRPLQRLGVSLNLPPLAENGNSVALGITLEAPERSDPVTQLYLFAEKNPLPDIARFKFSQPVTAQQLALRIRLADSQQIIAVAKTDSSNLFAASASIIVTLAACIDIPL